MQQIINGKTVRLLFQVFKVGDTETGYAWYEADTQEEAEAWIARNLDQEHVFYIRKVYAKLVK